MYAPVGSEDIASMNKHIRRAKAQVKWEQIGQGLRLSSATINGIKEENSRDDQRLYATLNAWVNGKEKVQTTWRVLIRALLSEDVNESALADTIMAEKGRLQLHYSVPIHALHKSRLHVLLIRISSVM